MECKLFVVSLVYILSICRCDDDLEDFEFTNPDPEEMMVAQESRQYHTFVKPPVRIIKPTGVTNSHRPQYNIDSLEEDDISNDFFEPTTKKMGLKDYKMAYKLRSKESVIRDAVLRALERKDHVGKFAQILPIIRAMSGTQRGALASLVASQVTTPSGRAPLSLSQVRSMFGNNANTSSDLMLPILLDMANLIRRAVRKEPREVKRPIPSQQPQIMRRSFTEDEDDTYLDDEPFETGYNISETKTETTTKSPTNNRNRRIRPQRTNTNTVKQTNKNTTPANIRKTVKESSVNTDKSVQTNKTELKNTTNTDNYEQDNSTSDFVNTTIENEIEENILSKSSTTASLPAKRPSLKPKLASTSSSPPTTEKASSDLDTDSTNQTLAQDLPIAEKLRAMNRFLDRKGNLIRRGNYPPKAPASAPTPAAVRRANAETSLNPVSRRRPPPARKLPTLAEQAKCELFTNTVCLRADDYPTDAIVSSIRRNKAAAGALLADFRNPGEGAVDGVSADQEAKYTADHYLVSNRRGDTASRDFAGAGEAGFMCPSTVKYARPQRARATSGHWKYIVNTGEHTQTLRLEKCLKPKEACTYLTDNFKSKCVQVYNYHRLLTWDQQNGLHMDIFKVPTCCSCHIEGYSVSFPPLGSRVHETSSENFPGEDLSSEHGNHALEAVQPTVQRPVSKTPPFLLSSKPLDPMSPFSDNQNFIAGTPFSNSKLNEEEFGLSNGPSGPMDSYGNTYLSDSFNQASSVRNVKRPLVRNPLAAFDQMTLPSYLEPPTPSAPASFSFSKDAPSKFKGTNQFKRGVPRPSRRPIRKKISSGPEDLVSSGTSAIESLTSPHIETLEDFNDDLEEPEVVNTRKDTIAPKLPAVTTEKVSTSKSEEKTKESYDGGSEKKVNYNYHPIIDYFGQGNEEGGESIDREDMSPTYIPVSESEWTPINKPPSRNIHSTNVVSKKKH